VITDSNTERAFVKDLDTSEEVSVYAKLPRGFFIPTPVGNYNPDWAISFKEGMVKHIYFVAETKGSMSSMELRGIEKTKIECARKFFDETKGSMSSMELRGIEKTKIECARKFFDEVNQKINPENVKYDVVNSYGKLMEIVGVSKLAPRL